MTQTHSTSSDSPRFSDRVRSLATSPYLWGGAATYAFYAAIPHLPAHRELAERYFTAHPVEYVQTVLFFVGFFILLRKLIGLRGQRAALRACAAPVASGSQNGIEQLQAVLAGWLSSLPKSRQPTWVAQRFADIRQYLQLRPSSDALQAHLKELDERAGDELHNSFNLLQTINWAIPIMGFLGTVLGITMAIFNLDVNHLDASLSDVTFNLAVAFDTTAVALCHSVILVFLYLFVKGSEERVQLQIASFCRQHILPLFPGEQQQPNLLLEAEADAARQLVERTGQLIDSQTKLWTDSIEALRERWTGTLETQQQSLVQSLELGTEATLSRHADQLAALRGELTQAFERLSQQRMEAERELRTREAAIVERWEAGSAKLADALAANQSAADERTARMLSQLSAQFDGWRSQLQSATSALETHVGRLTEQEARVCDLLEQGDSVISLEEKLNGNLQALRAAETFESTMHSLSAAVHLLTAHARQRAA
ncbi:MAG: MotA/TolQ/ExbB proton channel family protein [Planctomycetaceae bacterium]|nr:MotA/TolQ/ExbB proton channel family protein [Planctomycetaceae bacterium]